MVENLSGGTTNLLRMARSGCHSSVAFVALALGGQKFATATYPADPTEGLPPAASVEDLVRQLWLEPGLAQGKAIVRTVQLGGHQPGLAPTRFAVAALPLGVAAGGQPTGILGVADPDAKSFGLPELELLSRIAQRLTSYVSARQAVRTQLAAADPPHGAPPEGGVAAAGAALAPAQAPGGSADPSAQAPGAAAADPLAQAPAAAAADALAQAPAASVDPPVAQALAASVDPLGALLGGGDSVPGLIPLGALLGRAGRLLGAGTAAHGALAVIVLAVDGVPHQENGVVADLVRSLRTELRFDDPVASIGGLSFAAVVPLAPGGAGADQVESRLVERAREAVASHSGAVVRAAHVVAPLSAGREADELLRTAVVKLRASTGALRGIPAGPAPRAPEAR